MAACKVFGTISSLCRTPANKHILSCINFTSGINVKGPLVQYIPHVLQTQTVGLRTNAGASWNIPQQRQVIPDQEEVQETSNENNQITRKIISKVNEQILQKSHGRLFAVVHICGKQFKVTNEDIIVIEGYWPPQIGDKINLEKVLIAGGSDFTLVGRPILSRELVTVEATVIEKTLSHTKTHFRKKRRKQYMRINFHRSPFTMLRINSIDIRSQVNEKKEVEGVDGRIF